MFHRLGLRPLLFALSTPLVLGPAACATDKPAAVALVAPPVVAKKTRPDPHSFGRPQTVRVKHLDWTADVRVGQKRIDAVADLTIARAPGADTLILDTRALELRSVTDQHGERLSYHLGPDDELLGRALVVSLLPWTERVRITYRTTAGADALQWLTPQQTVGKKHPYLFTQGQAILTRTYIPIQDSPGVRVTYDAHVTVPTALRAVMSAEHLTPEGTAVGDGTRTRYDFHMGEAIPAYLIALAVGDIAHKKMGPRTGVFAEPAVLDMAAEEFSETEAMMTVTEKLYGPYRWGRYDILVLPPSFPFGGMENPRLTFVSPTTLAGDKSLTSIIAHELAHSWSGNLVTNATWADFWLNEGFTTYIENRILEAVYDKRRADLVLSLGRRDLLEEMEEFGADNPDTALYHPIDDQNPDDGINSIPYDKGSAFLKMLEKTLGRDAFDTFLKAHFDDNAFQSMTTKRFEKRLRAHFANAHPNMDADAQLHTWLYAPGLPSNMVPVSSDALSGLEAHATSFAAGGTLASPESIKYKALDWVILMRALPDDLDPGKLAKLEARLQLNTTHNSELRFEWLKLVVHNHYDPGVKSLVNFLVSQGRRRLVRPLYEGLMKSDWGRPKAQTIYNGTRETYHPLTQQTLDAIVRPDGQTAHAAHPPH